MKHIILASILLPSILIAQSPQPIAIRPQPPRLSQTPADALPDNYQVLLTLTDKDKQPVEVSVVVASTQFNASLGEQNLTFSGFVTIEDSGSMLIAYALGWQTQAPTDNNNVRYQSSEAQGSVRLKPGEEVQIIRAGTRTARLSIKKLEMTKAN